MRTAVATGRAPEAVGNYSQAVRAGDFLYLSGQVCLNPETGEYERESVAAQTRRALENVKAIVEEAGATLDDVVQCQVFLSSMDHFAEFDEVYRTYFTKPYPARITVASAGIYDDLDVEMTATVLLKKG